MSDKALVRRILGGDSAAGERLVTDQYPRLFRLLRQLTGSPETAEDLTQQTFLNAWKALPAFRGEASLATWLHRIAYHEYTHWLRGRREDVPLEAALDIPDPRAGDAVEAIMLERALAQLSPEHRETFLLYHVQGLAVPEVAVVMAAPAGTVKSRLFHARLRLRELLSEPQRHEEHKGAMERESEMRRAGRLGRGSTEGERR